MTMKDEAYIRQNQKLLYRTLEELTVIPAPSNEESARTAYCVEWLTRNTGENPLVQECGNVIQAYPCLEEKKNYTVFMAHLDTVFLADTALALKQDKERWNCPGIGDDTANVAILLLLAKYVFDTTPNCEDGILFVFDVGEEGLGNLRGSRALTDAFGKCIRKLISFDLYWDRIYTTCVGSSRYRISITTQGGHSFFDFGKENAIALMARLIGQIYDDKTGIFDTEALTYNVGVIEGGTSVNTISQDCSIQFEFRSVEAESLRTARALFSRMLAQLEAGSEESTVIECRSLGERPCAEMIDDEIMEAMAAACEAAIEEVTGCLPERGAASTDCNYPLSKGIPAICVGLIRGGGAHTLDEWIDPASLADGLRIAIRVFKNLMAD